MLSMAVHIACCVTGKGPLEIIAVEPMLDESKKSYSQFFKNLQQRDLKVPLLIVSDANKGFAATIANNFMGSTTWLM